MKNVIFLAIFSLILAGCSNNIALFSVASTENFQMDVEKSNYYVEGSDCVFNIIGIPIGNVTNRIGKATAIALEEATKKGFHAEALTNVQVDHTFWTAVFFGQDCIHVRGQPIIGQPAARGQSPTRGQSAKEIRGIRK